MPLAVQRGAVPTQDVRDHDDRARAQCRVRADRTERPKFERFADVVAGDWRSTDCSVTAQAGNGDVFGSRLPVFEDLAERG